MIICVDVQCMSCAADSYDVDVCVHPTVLPAAQRASQLLQQCFERLLLGVVWRGELCTLHCAFCAVPFWLSGKMLSLLLHPAPSLLPSYSLPSSERVLCVQVDMHLSQPKFEGLVRQHFPHLFMLRRRVMGQPGVCCCACVCGFSSRQGCGTSTGGRWGHAQLVAMRFSASSRHNSDNRRRFS